MKMKFVSKNIGHVDVGDRVRLEHDHEWLLVVDKNDQVVFLNDEFGNLAVAPPEDIVELDSLEDE